MFSSLTRLVGSPKADTYVLPGWASLRRRDGDCKGRHLLLLKGPIGDMEAAVAAAEKALEGTVDDEYDPRLFDEVVPVTLCGWVVMSRDGPGVLEGARSRK